jgi:hypothetical protein
MFYSREGIMIRNRFVHPAQLALALMLAAAPLGLVSGCDQAQNSSSAPMVKDAPPPPGEMTSDDYIKQRSAATKIPPGPSKRR